TGKPITIFGDGSQTRSFCYCSDLIEGIYRLMMCDAEDAHLPTNIGNPHEMTMVEFAREILKATGSKSRIVHRPLPQDDPKQRQPDISRARRLLGWEPKVPLPQGLTGTIEYFRSRV
ncbi:MAG: GDP-mannose 4,6-dehydratase, partial [Verrucomicrobiae bacterium]|nr:GDP-mannose 4,6-dehydratase [Verrucomicrobiae bacterium]